MGYRNYFLSGLHSYAQSDAPRHPGYVYVSAFVMMPLVFAAYYVDGSRSWEGPPPKPKKAKAAAW